MWRDWGETGCAVQIIPSGVLPIPQWERSLEGNYCLHFPVIQIFSCNFIFRENGCSNHPAGYHHISFPPSEVEARKCYTRTLMDNGCSSTQPSPDNYYSLIWSLLVFWFFLLSMKMSGLISHPAGILDLAFSLGFFRPCFPYIRNSLVLLPCFGGEVHGETEMLGKRKPL